MSYSSCKGFSFGERCSCSIYSYLKLGALYESTDRVLSQMGPLESPLQGGVALGDIGDMVEAMPGKDVSHSSSHHSSETSNCTVFSDRLGLFVSLMHALLSWQQQILLSLNGILKKLPLKISSYLTRYYQGMKTFLFKRCLFFAYL